MTDDIETLRRGNERLQVALSEANAAREACAQRAFRLESEVERLREENERLRNTKHYEAPFGFVLNPDYLVPELKAENERLREALKKYGQHRSDCAKTLGGYQCTCGFNQQGQSP